MLFKEKARLRPRRGESGQSFLKCKGEGFLQAETNPEREGRKKGKYLLKGKDKLLYRTFFLFLNLPALFPTPFRGSTAHAYKQLQIHPV